MGMSFYLFFSRSKSAFRDPLGKINKHHFLILSSSSSSSSIRPAFSSSHSGSASSSHNIHSIEKCYFRLSRKVNLIMIKDCFEWHLLSFSFMCTPFMGGCVCVWENLAKRQTPLTNEWMAIKQWEVDWKTFHFQGQAIGRERNMVS